MNARELASRLVGRSYVASKRFAQLRMRGGGPPVVVFSMGKTGSTAIARSVQDATGARVFQVFRLEPTRLAEAEQRYRAQHERPAPGAVPFPGALHLWESEHLLHHPPTASAPWRVITTVREPVAQAVSAFFHGSGQQGDGSGQQGAGSGQQGAGSGQGGAPGNWSVEESLERMLADNWLRAPLRWFDREFAPALGIDVFAHPFDPGAGSGEIDTSGARVLLLRQENLADAPGALGSFLGRTAPVPVAARNEARSKGYAARYQEFLAAARFDASVLDEVYDSRYARHFYADSERERFRRRWADGPESTTPH